MLFSAPVLLQGRVKLVEKEEGERFKLKARDNNAIDTMFVDRRNKGYDCYYIATLCLYLQSRKPYLVP